MNQGRFLIIYVMSKIFFLNQNNDKVILGQFSNKGTTSDMFLNVPIISRFLSFLLLKTS